jgi:hypothetical protein
LATADSARLGTKDGQTSVGHAGDGHGGLLAQVAQVLAHLIRPGGTVQADSVDAEGLERRERGADLGSHEHGSGGLDGHLDQDLEPDSGCRMPRASRRTAESRTDMTWHPKNRVTALDPWQQW